MKTIFLVRNEFSDECIRGSLIADGELFEVLEPPWRLNKPNVSCIPAGLYDCEYLKRSSSGRYRDVYWLKNVEDRSGVLIHHGNTADHTRGCLIIGERRGTLAGKRAVLNSRSALFGFVDKMEREPFRLRIIGGQKC